MSCKICSSIHLRSDFVPPRQAGHKQDRFTMESPRSGVRLPNGLRRSERLQSHESERVRSCKVPASITIKILSRKCHVSVPRHSHRPSILNLPPEIRNRTLRFALAPGDIYLPAKSSSIITKAHRKLRAQDPIDAVVKRINYPYLSKVLKAHQASQDTRVKYGCQVLATCKQLYCEGHAVFYSLNTFHLAPGPLRTSIEYFDKLQPHHKALIKHVSVDLGIADLTPNLLSELNARVSGRSLIMPVLSTTPPQDNTSVSVCLARMTKELWVSKLMYVLTWRGLSDIRIQHHNPCRLNGQSTYEWRQVVATELVIEHSHLRAMSLQAKARDVQMATMMMNAYKALTSVLIAQVANYGWKGFSEWLEFLEFGPMECLETRIWQEVCFSSSQLRGFANND